MLLHPHVRSLAALVIASVPAAAFGQSSSAPDTAGAPAPGSGFQAFADPSQLFSGQEGAFIGLGFNKISGEGVYASTIIQTEFGLGDISVGLAVPVNVLVWNNADCCGPDPATHTRDFKTYNGLIRRADWQEPRDWLKFVRFVRYGHKREPVYALAGQLWGASLGHGTLVSRYSNSLNLDHPKLGLALDLNSDYAGVETLMDHVGDPGLIGGRAYVRPFADVPMLRGFAIGATAVADRTAPRALSFTSGGMLQPGKDGSPLVAESAAAYAIGVDLEYEVLRNRVISVIPYLDANRIAGAGNGLHVGVLADVYVPIPVLELNVQSKLEYRVMRPGYIPEYFDQTYDLGRFQYLTTSPPTGSASDYSPKYAAAVAAHDAGGAPRKGYYGELALAFAGIVQVGGLYADYDGDPAGASLGLFATLPKFDIIKVSAYYLRKNMKSGFDDAFKLDERSLLAASFAYKIFGPMYLRVDFQRRWLLQPDTNRIQAVDVFNAGIAAFVSF